MGGTKRRPQLFNAQGRRFETREHIEELIRLKAVNWNETLSLIDLRGPFTLVTFDNVVDKSEMSLLWLGEMRTAYVGHDRNRSDAIATVKQIVDVYPNSAAAAAFYGRLLVENGRDQTLQNWFANLPDGIQRQPEYWTTLGTWLQHHNRHREAIRAFGEALRLDPGNREALRELIESLDSTGAEKQAVPLRKQLATLDQIFRIARDADAEQSMWIASEMQKFTRPWEAMAWMMRSAQLAGKFPQVIPELNRRAISVAQWESSTTPDRIAEVRLATLLGFDISDWPIPELGNLQQDHTAVAASTSSETSTDDVHNDSLSQLDTSVHTIQLDDIAGDIGIATHTDTGYFDQDSFYAYQVDGSGIGVVDFDLNGLPDLYIVQSAGPPNDPLGSNPNQLFRSLPDGSFADVTLQSGTGDRGYGAGVAVGDVNQDGFPDLLIGNVGVSVLFVNQGDGSFRDASDLIQDNPVTWTSSFAIADLNGDHLPEMIQVNYINDQTAFEIKCTGGYLHCQPQRFRAAADRVLKGNSDGTFSTWQSLRTIDDDPKLGLGVVVANFDKQHGNDFFVANDGDLNHFWSSIPADADADDRFSMVESAGIRGCSIGQGGTSQACMGIAAADFNRDGMLDVHVTNFYHEPVNLFIQNRLGFFSDQAMSYGLQAPSMPVLGFGTQAGDYDNDGWPDLATLNGHVFDATDQGVPFRMQAQLLKGDQRGFTLQQPTAAGDYWQREQLGRALATWDWNQDGRMDLVANHLDQPVAVLQNNSDALNWIQLELIGTTSERDAIGAIATITAGPESWTAHRTAGDGYMVSNEAVLHFGIGNLTSLEHVEIQWPSGQIQSFDNVASNARYLLIEGASELYRRTE
ncbi:FG-GAP-like repeat-containing protein [Novipirellula sp. SH528]|uniref:FG-GAP-like repeat-containing protein n=1 Tax=Novipirellula sp. SH528 TaxID=3454466 RepID=UPI003FA12CBF